MESDLDLLNSAPTTKSQTPFAEPAGGPLPLPPLTDNAFVHMPPFEQERKFCAQAGVLDVGTSGTVRQAVSQSSSQTAVGAGQLAGTAAAAQLPMGDGRLAAAKGRGGLSRRSHGFGGSLTEQPKRLAAAWTSDRPPKRRKPELLSASALAAIAASVGPAAAARAVPATGAMKCSPNVTVSDARGSSRPATGPLGKPCGEDKARTVPTIGTLTGNLNVEPWDEQACTMLIPTEIFS